MWYKIRIKNEAACERSFFVAILILSKGRIYSVPFFVVSKFRASTNTEMKIKLLLHPYFEEEGCESYFRERDAVITTAKVCNLWMLNFEVNCFTIQKIK